MKIFAKLALRLFLKAREMANAVLPKLKRWKAE